MTMPRIIRNAIRCKKCGEVIESETVHDFKFCGCGASAVGGPGAPIKIAGAGKELSEVEKVEDNGALT